MFNPVMINSLAPQITSKTPSFQSKPQAPKLSSLSQDTVSFTGASSTQAKIEDLEAQLTGLKAQLKQEEKQHLSSLPQAQIEEMVREKQRQLRGIDEQLGQLALKAARDNADSRENLTPNNMKEILSPVKGLTEQRNAILEQKRELEEYLPKPSGVNKADEIIEKLTRGW